MHLEAVAKHLQFPMNILRPCNAYCPGQLLHRVIPKAIWCGLTGRKLPLHGGGKAEKSYIHARDLARAIHLVSEKAPFGVVYNVGSDLPITILEVVQRCAVALGVSYSSLFDVAENRLGQDSRYWLDSHRVRKAVGWEPQVGWDEGLGEMVEWGKRYLDQIKDLSPEYVLRA